MAFREADRVAWAESWSSRSRTGLDAVRVGPTSISSGRRPAQGPRGGLRNPRAVSVFTPWWRAICSPPRSRATGTARSRGEGCRDQCLAAGSWRYSDACSARSSSRRSHRPRRRPRSSPTRRVRSRAPCSPTASTSARTARARPCPPSTASRSTSTSRFPAEADFGPGPYPLMMMFHGYGGGKIGLGSMQHWLDRGYATFSMTDRGFRESCGSAASQTRRRPRGRLRRRLRAPDRQPLRGPRRAGVRRPARRREPDRPAADRRDRRLLRRRHVDGARRAQEPQGAARTTASSPGRARTASRCRSRRRRRTSPGPTSPTRCSRTAARSTTSPTLPTRAGSGSRSSRCVGGLYFSGLGAPGYYAPVGTDPTADMHRLAHPARAR